MKKVLLFFLVTGAGFSQSTTTLACSANPVYRQLDFWVGEWDVYSPKRGRIVASSKIERILDSCVILENFTQGTYSGKSFTTYNELTHQWQQTWVDNGGHISEFRKGHAEENRLVLVQDVINPDGSSTKSQTRMTFDKLNENTVRQLGEKSDDAGKTWAITFDLEYRRKK
jgi:hypothetical protein